MTPATAFAEREEGRGINGRTAGMQGAVTMKRVYPRPRNREEVSRSEEQRDGEELCARRA